MFRKNPSFALLLAAALLLGACAPTATPTTPPEIEPPAASATDAGDPADADPAGAEPGTLVIYSGRSESLVGPIIQQFADATGVDVQVRYGSTSEMAIALLEEGSNSPADIFFAQDPGGLGAVEDAGLLAELPADILEQVDAFYTSPNGRWVGISGRARVVVYNTERLQPADLPDDLMGFTDPEWSGRLGIAPANGSFQTMVTGMRELWGEEETRAWLEAIAANEPTFYENNTSIVAATAAGEVDAGLVNHYYLYRFLAEEGESFPARNHYLAAGGPGSLVMVAGAGRLAEGPNEPNALRFLNFMLSPVAQQYFASQTYEYPLVEGVAVSSLLLPLSELNPPEIALGSLADLQGTVEMLQEVGLLP
jgi:iron(III) transport system substrate-binding protein